MQHLKAGIKRLGKIWGFQYTQYLKAGIKYGGVTVYVVFESSCNEG